MRHYILIVLFLSSLITPFANAEVILDGTLGRAGALTGPSYQITSDLGRQVGGNLFHSFSAFNVRWGESAHFSGSSGINNIISRVTGGSASLIEGQIRSSIAGADFYLINPKGFIIGPYASIDVGGAFRTASADYIRLGAGGVFHASMPSESILTTAPPSAFGFLNPPQGITINGSGIIRLKPGQEFTLVGGKIELNYADLRINSGSIDIAAVASAGELNISHSDRSYKGFSGLGNISMKNCILSVDGEREGGGALRLRGNDIEIRNSILTSQQNGSEPSFGIDIRAEGSLDIKGGTVQSVTEGSARGGDISLSGQRISLTEGARIIVSARDTGRGGDIRFDAGESVKVYGVNSSQRSGIYNQTFGKGVSGSINITSPVVLMSDYAVILNYSSGTAARGLISFNADNMSLTKESVVQGGNIKGNLGRLDISDGAYIWSTPLLADGRRIISLDIKDALIITGQDQSDAPWRNKTAPLYTGIHTDTFINFRGDAGDILINSPYIRMTNSAQIGARTYSNYSAGKITINTAIMELLSGSQIGVDSYGSSIYSGEGGSIIINASDSVTLSGRNYELFSGFSSATRSSGGAGSITVKTPHLSLSDEAGIVVATGIFGTGSAGIIRLDVRSIDVDSEAGISASNAGYGSKEGVIEINASEAVEIKNGGYIVSWGDQEGSAGSILINTTRFLMSEGSVSTITYGDRDAGSIMINSDFISLSKGSSISSQSSMAYGRAGVINLNSTGSISIQGSSVNTASDLTTGGNINLQGSTIMLTNQSTITAAVGGGEGNGGNVNINSGSLSALQESSIIAKADQGFGGNITINSQAVILSKDSNINASSNIIGRDGKVQVNAPAVDVAGNLVILSTGMMDISELVPKMCREGADDMSSFVVKGREGLPPLPF